MYKLKHNKNNGMYWDKELLRSQAYKALSGTAKYWLGLFLQKRVRVNCSDLFKDERFMKLDGFKQEALIEEARGKEWITLNNGQIQFSYDEGKKVGIGTSSFRNAVDDCLAKGFTAITRSSNGLHKVPTLYAEVDDWKTWTKGQVSRTREKSERPSPHKFPEGNKEGAVRKKAKEIETAYKYAADCCYELGKQSNVLQCP